MALVDNAWYVDFGNGSSTGYYAVTAWTALTSFDCGALIRQSATPSVGSERVFVAVVGHVASGAAEPTWTVTRGAKTTDVTITWQEATGIAALNGDLSTNTPNWTTVKNTAVTLGQVIQNNAGNLILICTTAGTAGNAAEPSWAAYTTAGATTADNTVTWTTLGASFSAWASPHARLANAFASTWGQAGNSFFVASEHTETQASQMILSNPGTSANPCLVYCVDHAGSVPPVSADLRTTATITVTGNNDLYMVPGVYYYGITFTGGSGGSFGGLIVGGISAGYLYLQSCILFSASSGGAGAFLFGNSSVGSNITLENTTVKVGSASQSIGISSGRILWKNTASAIAGATIPTTLFAAGTGPDGGVLTLQGIDLSALGSGKTIVGATTEPFNVILQDCSLGASVTVAAAATSANSADIYVIRSDSSGTNYRHEKYQYQGSQVVETTIVRTGGASDGTTPVAWKLVTTANSKWVLPFQAIPITIWNDTAGSSITVTVYGIWGGGAVPNNDEIWMDVEYLGASGNPLGTFATATKADNLATGSALASDTSTWGGSTTKFKMTCTFTPQQKGYLNIYVKAATASTTFYIDPLAVLS